MASGLPASPSLGDLGDPAWLEAYKAAGGHVQPLRSADGDRPAQYLVNHPRHRVGVPSPTFFRMLEQAQAKAALAEQLAEEVRRLRETVGPGAAPPDTSSPREAAVVPAQEVVGDSVLSQMKSSGMGWAETFCPRVSKAMTAAHDGIMRGDDESLAQAATSLRRALVALADHVEPPGGELRPDHTNRLLRVGREQFKNRLYIYLGKKLESSQRRYALANLDLVEGQLDAVARLLGKAIHADGARADLEQLYLSSWSVITQVVHCAEMPV
jgi:hypothetical protein